MSYKGHIALASAVVIIGAAGYFGYSLTKEHYAYVAKKAAEEQEAKVAAKQLSLQIQSVNRKTSECINTNRNSEDTRYINELNQLDENVQNALIGVPMGAVERIYNIMSVEVRNRHRTMEVEHSSNYNKILSNCTSNFVCPERSTRESGSLDCSLAKQAT